MFNSSHVRALFYSGAQRSGSGSIGYGGPAYFGGRNDLPAELAFEALLAYFVCLCIYVAFAFTVVSSRRRRVSTLVVGTVVAATALAISMGLTCPGWLVARQRITTHYCALHPRDRVVADLGIHVGLSDYNVTLRAVNVDSFSFNNRFELEYGGIHRRKRDQEFVHKLQAIELGLPNPMIVVAEYMESLEWERRLPSAGHFARACLYFAAASLSACALLVVLIPSHALRMFVVTGALLLLTVAVYWGLIPHDAGMHIRVDGVAMPFEMGPAFLAILVMGCVDVAFGMTLLSLRRLTCLREFSTFFELDFDTAWDNRKIKEHAENRKEEEEKRLDRLTTQFYVDSRLRVTMRRFRQSLRSSRRTRERATSLQEEGQIHREEEGGAAADGGDGGDGDGLRVPKGSRARSLSADSCKISEVSFANESLI